jgi:hypothetical protein
MLDAAPERSRLGLLSLIETGTVWGIDTNEVQIKQAREHAAAQQIGNVNFQVGSCYALPFEDASFDRVFCHALLEHLATPHKALAEYFRVLKPGGSVGVCSPDWDGLLLAPASPELTEAADAYARLQETNGGDLRIGHKLGAAAKIPMRKPFVHGVRMKAACSPRPGSQQSGANPRPKKTPGRIQVGPFTPKVQGTGLTPRLMNHSPERRPSCPSLRWTPTKNRPTLVDKNEKVTNRENCSTVQELIILDALVLEDRHTRKGMPVFNISRG